MRTTYLLLAAVLGTASAAPSIELARALPLPSGPHLVGTIFVNSVDSERSDELRPDLPREVVAQVWYPAARAPRTAPLPYAPPMVRAAMKREGYLRLDERAIDTLAGVTSQTYSSAPVAPGLGLLPVVVLSHDLGVSHHGYTGLGQELASHGYAVVAIDHPYGGLAVLPDGRVLALSQRPVLGDPLGLEELAGEWARDIGLVLDRLANKSGSPLAVRLDLDRVAALGHGLGAAAALEAACGDERVVAAVCMGDVPVERIRAEGACPATLALRCDPALPRTRVAAQAPTTLAEFFWNDLQERASDVIYLVEVGGARPESFCDAPFVLATAGSQLDALRAQRVFQVEALWIRHFLDRHLRWKPETSEGTEPEVGASSSTESRESYRPVEPHEVDLRVLHGLRRR